MQTIIFDGMKLANFDESYIPRQMNLQNAPIWHVLKFIVYLGFASAFPFTVSAQVYEIGTDHEVVLVSIAPHSAEQFRPSRVAPAQQLAFNPSVTRKLMPANWKIIVTDIADQYKIDPILFEALVWQESRWIATARSPKGAIGLTQLMPGTARLLGINPFDPVDNLEGGARYLKLMLAQFNGDMDLALAAYNAGPMRIAQYGGVPPFTETKNYVASIRQRILWGKALED
jgi:soluble lytic murein transglycosylase-like protein